MRKWAIDKKILDKCVLLIMAIIVLTALVGSIYLLENYAAMSKEWVMFIFFCVLYVLITTYKSAGSLKRLHFNWRWVLLLIFIELLIIVIGVVGVYYKVLALPHRGIFIWGLGVLVISYLTSSTFSSLVKKYWIRK